MSSSRLVLLISSEPGIVAFRGASLTVPYSRFSELSCVTEQAISTAQQSRAGAVTCSV